MKKSLPVLLAIWPYLFFILAMAVEQDYYKLLLPAYAVLTIFVYAANVIYACRYRGEDAYKRLAFWGMLIKLVHIPFHLLMGLLGVALLAAIVVPALLILSPVMIFFLNFVSVLLMLTTSAYGISALVRAKRRKAVSGKFTLVNLIMHFVFVLDVVSSIVVFQRLRKQKVPENSGEIA